jgi:UDP-glucose 4-epimerase
MPNLLITGTSGFVGGALARRLAATGRHTVTCLSRKPTEADGANCLRGVFHSFEDLRMLDAMPIDVVVHLAAVTGGCREEDGIMVNVEGTRRLMRYAIDRGCRKFVMASSIAAVGFQHPSFRPLQVPIPDEHPCLDRLGYGLSKYLMEEVTRYYWRQHPDIDIINLRLSTVVPNDRRDSAGGLRPLGQWALGSITIMILDDAVQAFTLAAEAPLKPGVRILNAAGPEVWSTVPTADILTNWWGDEVDVSHFEQPGHEYDSAFDVRRIREELGFVAQCTPRR